MEQRATWLQRLSRAFLAFALVAAAVALDLGRLPAEFRVAEADGVRAVPQEQPVTVFTDVDDVKRYLITMQCDERVSQMGEPLAKQLQSQDYSVRWVDDYLLGRTLVVYRDDAVKPVAKKVAANLDNCQIVYGAQGYHFEGDVLVLVGWDATLTF